MRTPPQPFMTPLCAGLAPSLCLSGGQQGDAAAPAPALNLLPSHGNILQADWGVCFSSPQPALEPRCVHHSRGASSSAWLEPTSRERWGRAAPRWGSAPTPHSAIPYLRSSGFSTGEGGLVLNHPFGNTPLAGFPPPHPKPPFLSGERCGALGMCGKSFSLMAHIAA